MAGNKNNKPGKANDRSLPAATRDKIANGISNITNSNISKAFTTIFQQADLGADFIRHLQRGKVYLAEIPKKIQSDFDDGKVKFMTLKETGEQVSELVGPNNFGTRSHMIIKDADIVHSNIPHDLATIAMQQQLAQLAAVLDDVRSRLIEMKQTYDESLLGELRGMRDLLSQVQTVEDLETQYDLIKGSLVQLNVTRGKITQRLIAEMQKMPEVPTSTFKRYFRAFTKEGFLDNVISGYEKIQELFGYYLAASQLLAYAYALIGEEKVYETVFTPDNELENDQYLNNLINSEDIVGVEGERWYNNPQRFLGLIQKEAHRIFFEASDVITIELTGEQLLEAVQNARSEKKECKDKG